MIRRITAFLVTVIMILGLVPSVAFADLPVPPGDRPLMQRPVSDSTMVVNPVASGDGSYNLNIMWTRPGRSTALAPSVPVNYLDRAVADGMWRHFPTHYFVNFRNATRGDDFGSDPTLQPLNVPAPPNGQSLSRPPGMRLEVSTGPQNLRMDGSSLYEIRIDPRKPIPVMVPTNTPPYQEMIRSYAPIDNSPGPGMPLGRDLLFLTDIAVEGRGRGNSITITWQNPTWGGVNVFPYWQITYGNFEPGRPVSGSRIVRPVGGANAGTGQITQNPDGTLTYTIFDPAIRPIGFQSVSIEPAFGPNPDGVQLHRVRQGQPSAERTIGGRNFSIYFTTNEYRVDVAMVPELFIEQAGAQFLRLWWPHLTGLVGEGAGDRRLERVEVEEWAPELGGTVPSAGLSPMAVLRILGGEAFLGINHFFVGPGIPRTPRGFALSLHFSDGSVERTEVVVFDPMLAEFSPYRPEIVRLDHVGNGALSMEWLAFLRFPAVAEEIPSIPEGDPFNGRFVDTAVYYEIFVSNSWEDMARMTTPLKTITPGELEANRRLSPVQPQPYPPVFDPTWQLWSFDFITQYQALTEEGIVVRNITGNRVYFVRIRAVRVPDGQASTWAYGSVYVPPLQPMVPTPEMIASPPVEIPHDEHTHITATTIPLRWDTRYIEIMWPNRNTANFQRPYPDRDLWYTVIGVDMQGRPIYGRSAMQIQFALTNPPPPGTPPRHEFLNRMLEPALRDRLLGNDEFPMNPNLPSYVAPFLAEARDQIDAFTMERWSYRFHTVNGVHVPAAFRIQNTDTFRYEIHVARYETVRLNPQGFEGYRDSIPANGWTSIGQPQITNGVANHVVTGLSVNTSYVIFIRPYVLQGTQRITAAFPTFVKGTTVTVPDNQVPNPTTPVLHPVPRYTTRNRVGVRWRVQDNMVYELRISHFFTDYPNGGTVIPIGWEAIQAVRDGQTVELENPNSILNVIEIDGIPYFHLRIHERFPDTNYHIWARAIGVNASGATVTSPSLPSNPVDIHTLPIEPPPPPRSFARAPQRLLDMFNRYNETTYRNDEPEAITVSFMRIFDDLRDAMGNFNERAEAGTADGDVRALNLPNLDATEAYVAIHMIRFEELIANRTYFLRARTILTVQRGGPDIYSYEIQLADNEDFFEATTFIIPPLIAEHPFNTRRAYSVWVEIELDTGVSDGEFDSVHRPDQFPLPERDWEITYNPQTRTLTWRFRTNQRGEDGRLDQNVDQRFITRLIQDNTFMFTADLSEHRGYPVANREIIVPESILRTFDERGIVFEILAGDKNIQIPPGAFNTAQTRALQPGIGTYYRIALNSVSSGMPSLITNTSFATVPQRFSVTAMAPQRSANLTTFARPVMVELPVLTHMTPDGLRTGLFVADTNTASWRDTAGQFCFLANSLNSGIQEPTTFAGVSRMAPQMAVPQSPANAPMQRVATRMTITDMTTFEPSRNITQGEFNNIVNALITNQTSVTMGASLSAESERNLTGGRMLAPANLTRESGIDIMVRLYENRTRQRLTPMTPENSIPGIQNANPALVRNLRIAADVGFIAGPLEPHGRLTMGEMMSMVDIIILDAGM